MEGLPHRPTRQKMLSQQLPPVAPPSQRPSALPLSTLQEAQLLVVDLPRLLSPQRLSLLPKPPVVQHSPLLPVPPLSTLCSLVQVLLKLRRPRAFLHLLRALLPALPVAPPLPPQASLRQQQEQQPPHRQARPQVPVKLLWLVWQLLLVLPLWPCKFSTRVDPSPPLWNEWVLFSYWVQNGRGNN